METRSQMEGERSHELGLLEAAKLRQKNEAVSNAKLHEEHLQMGLGGELNRLEMQLKSARAEMRENEIKANNMELSRSERRKAREMVKNLEEHQKYLDEQVFKISNRIEATKKLIWYQVRARKEMIDTVFEQERSLTLRKYAEVFARMVSPEAIARAQEQALAAEGAPVNALATAKPAGKQKQKKQGDQDEDREDDDAFDN